MCGGGWEEGGREALDLPYRPAYPPALSNCHFSRRPIGAREEGGGEPVMQLPLPNQLVTQMTGFAGPARLACLYA